jgi:hypothetical protein
LQRLAGDRLQLRIKRRADREPAFVKRVVAIAANQFAPDFLGKVLRGEQVGAGLARNVTPRGCAFASAPSSADIAVLDHAVDHPVAAFDRAFGMAEGMIIVGRLRKRCKIGGFGDGQLVDRFVEIGQRSPAMP